MAGSWWWIREGLGNGGGSGRAWVMVVDQGGPGSWWWIREGLGNGGGSGRAWVMVVDQGGPG